MTTQVLLCCQAGDIVVELDESKAPGTCANFIAYMQAGAYDDTSFFRIVTPQQMGDDPERQIAVVQGGPKFNIKGHDPELSLFQLDHEPTIETGLSHEDGTISMGRFAPGETYGGVLLLCWKTTRSGLWRCAFSG